MTFNWKLTKGKSIYLYHVKNHSLNGTNILKQFSRQIGKEITVDGKAVVQEADHSKESG